MSSCIYCPCGDNAALAFRIGGSAPVCAACLLALVRTDGQLVLYAADAVTVTGSDLCPECSKPYLRRAALDAADEITRILERG